MRVLVADSDLGFVEQIKKYVEEEEDIQFIGSVNRGQAIIPALNKFCPDVLLMELVFPDQDGLEVLKSLFDKCSKKPKIIIISVLGNDVYVQKANELGADFYLVKPFSLATLTKRIRQVSAMSSSQSFHHERQRQLITERIIHYFSAIGMPPHYKGYRYLVEAISLVIFEQEYLDKVTKRLYPMVAERFDTTPLHVERAIRHAIEMTWERGSFEQLNQLFPYSIDAQKGKPTNSSFIAAMAERIRLDIDLN